ncbi:chorismate-binding protein [Paucihalobacter sp.]|uniref:chorismate-binding protein n=1 Tax=Paucihalobacter sp. TaxID=2850405 RepID=UPI002FE22B33
MNSFLQNIQQHFNNQLPFVVYRAPHSQRINAVLQKNTDLHVANDYTEKGFVFAPFQEAINTPTVLFPISECEIKSAEYTNLDTFLKSSETEEISIAPIDYKVLIENAISKIHQNDFNKVVLSRKMSSPLSNTQPLEIFERMLQKYPSAFVYCWFHPKIGLWLGATPEILMTIQGNTLRTVALAGTQNFNGTVEVSWGDKELTEQQIVTDYIVSQLNAFKLESSKISVSKAKTIKAGNLLHLQTEIISTVNQSQFSVKDLLQQLHPTPAVCGDPKENALQFILQNEGYNRDYYSGFLGELNMTKTQNRNTNWRNTENNAYKSLKTVSNFYVNLRCMQILGTEAQLYVGGGITKDSNPQSEWHEIMAKLQTVKSVL